MPRQHSEGHGRQAHLSQHPRQREAGGFSFEIGRRKGCPPSPPPSNVALEVLGRAMGQERGIEGIHVGGEEADYLCVQMT